MPDFNDAASEHEDQDRADAIMAQALRAQHAPAMHPRGFCQNLRCGEEFPPGDQRLFCHSRCAAEHQQRRMK